MLPGDKRWYRFFSGAPHLLDGYDPVLSQWTIRNTSPISGFVTSFVINGFVYLLQGRTVWRHNSTNDTYIQKSDFPGPDSYGYPSSFVINGIGYYVSGSSCWEYNAANDDWKQKAGLPGHLEVQAGFSLNNYGYVLADSNRKSRGSDYPLQLWKYEPLQNKWSRIYDDYPGDGTSQVKAVSVDGAVYVGYGYKKLNNPSPFDDLAGDFWKFEE